MNPRARSTAVALVGLAAIGGAAVLPPSGFGWPTCIFHRLTGLPCPSCGLTRSWVAALDGNLETAVSLHIAGPPLLVATALIVALALVDAASGSRRLEQIWSRARRPLTWGTVALLCAAWLANLVH